MRAAACAIGWVGAATLAVTVAAAHAQSHDACGGPTGVVASHACEAQQSTSSNDVGRASGAVVRAAPAVGADFNDAGESKGSRLGLQFKPVKRSADMPFGALRFQLSNASTLSLRPRGGGVAMSYRATF